MRLVSYGQCMTVTIEGTLKGHRGIVIRVKEPLVYRTHHGLQVAQIYVLRHLHIFATIGLAVGHVGAEVVPVGYRCNGIGCTLCATATERALTDNGHDFAVGHFPHGS